MRFSGDFLDVVFDDLPLGKLIFGLQVGQTLSAATLLTALGSESEEVLRQSFQLLEDSAVALDISDLPKAPGTMESAVRLRTEEQLAHRGALIQGLEEGDPLRIYLEEIAAMPACGDVRLLSQQLAEQNEAGQADEQLLADLLNLSLSRVVELACAHTGYGVLLLDLIQEGSMELWQKLHQFQGGDFARFRDDQLRWAMAKAVVIQARELGFGQKMRQSMEDYRAMDEHLLGEYGRNPTQEEIAEALHMSVEEMALVGQMLEDARRMNLAKQVPEPEEEELAQTQAVEDTAYFQMRQRIADLLSALDETDAKLLTLRYGLEAGLPMSAAEVGKQLGLTADEVTAREAAALAKLRNET